MRRWRGRSDPLPGRGSNDTHLTVAQDLCQKLCVSDLIVSESSVFCLFVTCLYWNQALCFKIIDNKTLTININWKKISYMVWFIHFESFEVVCFRQMNIFRYFQYSDSNFHCISYFIFFSSIFNTLKKNQALKNSKAKLCNLFSYKFSSNVMRVSELCTFVPITVIWYITNLCTCITMIVANKDSRGSHFVSYCCCLCFKFGSPQKF